MFLTSSAAATRGEESFIINVFQWSMFQISLKSSASMYFLRIVCQYRHLLFYSRYFVLLTVCQFLVEKVVWKWSTLLTVYVTIFMHTPFFTVQMLTSFFTVFKLSVPSVADWFIFNLSFGFWYRCQVQKKHIWKRNTVFIWFR